MSSTHHFLKVHYTYADILLHIWTFYIVYEHSTWITFKCWTMQMYLNAWMMVIYTLNLIQILSFKVVYTGAIIDWHFQKKIIIFGHKCLAVFGKVTFWTNFLNFVVFRIFCIYAWFCYRYLLDFSFNWFLFQLIFPSIDFSFNWFGFKLIFLSIDFSLNTFCYQLWICYGFSVNRFFIEKMTLLKTNH